ncbi:MAG: polyphosphate polymerase domain-containing protein [Muribaculaceae bacterium]|nr:polyphosphate polymerase domain-containing protein [Muribaculaceae bacterium]
MTTPSLLKKEVIAEFDPISLEEMGKVKLMNRVDTKYVTHIDQIETLLKLASALYRIQEIDGERNMPYYTCYYDTQESDMYYQHQRGKKTRQKIRRRIYEGSHDLTFLEIKSKNNKGRTKKKRVSMEDDQGIEGYSEFIGEHSNYNIDDLAPKIENHFYRITLVNHDMTERLTIDTGLEFHNFETGVKVCLPNIGIIEWKRDGNNIKSPLKDLLFKLRIHEGGFSKYCIGMAVTNPALRQNRIKQRLRKIQKINPIIREGEDQEEGRIAGFEAGDPVSETSTK